VVVTTSRKQAAGWIGARVALAASAAVLVVAAPGCGSGGGGGGGGSASGTVGGGGADGGAAGVRPAPAIGIFDTSKVHDVALTMSADDWTSIIADSEGDTERHATVVFDGVTIDDVGVHPSGESSRFPGNPKMSVRLKFDAFAGGKFGGISELKLKGQWDDGSMMRDGLAKFVYRATVPTGAEAYCRLVVNGDLRGLYGVLEMWDAESIKTRFSDPAGPLYRIRGVPGMDPYKYLGDAATAYMPLPWEAHINKPAVGDEVIGAALGVLANTPEMIGTVMDVDTLLGYLAASTLVQSVDYMVGDSGVQDHYQYYDTASKTFFSLPWDPDKTFGYGNATPDRWIYEGFSNVVPAAIIHNSADLRARFQAKIATVMAAAPVAAVQAEADRVYQQIAATAHEDPVKRFDNGTFDWNLGFLKDFVAQRYANVQQQLGGGP
jgi:hypothetical protein